MPIMSAPDSTVIETESLFFVIAYAFSVLFLLFFRGLGQERASRWPSLTWAGKLSMTNRSHNYLI
ncbi:hypothetical protein Q672_01505 [Marinobacter sp. EVN1]|nr:hypothetical protein Q672_01505 [Marinobacter sp. EVN1]